VAREQLIRSWGWALAAVGYLTAVYATLPFARALWRHVEPWLGGRPTLPFLLAGAALAAALAARAWTAGPARRVAALALLAAVLAAYAWLLLGFYRGRLTIEKVHLIEYGLLAYLTLNAVTVTRRGGPGAAVAVLFVAAAGVGDEALQKLIPNRVFDLYDIAANWLGGTLGAAAWVAASAASPWRRSPAGMPEPVAGPGRPA
jgi:VanZ family protein